MDTVGPDLFDFHLADLLEAEANRDALRLTPGTLTEVIIHGDYYHRRETQAGEVLSAEELLHFVSGSPYVYRLSRGELARMLAQINGTGRTDFGWSDFHLERPRSL